MMKKSLEKRRNERKIGRENGIIYTAFIVSILYYVLG